MWTFFADHTRSFKIAFIGDENDGSRAAGRHGVMIANARQNVGRFLIRSPVSDGVDDYVSVDVVLLPYVEILVSTTSYIT